MTFNVDPLSTQHSARATSHLLDWLYEGQRRGIKLGLDNVRRLLAALGNPQHKFAAIHIAGTNGKGSVAAMAAALLREHGWQTGLFTSPHLIDFRERFQINGEMISEEACVEGLEQIRDAVNDWEPQPTYFEIVTALGFAYFARQGVDWAVVEVGMGGRLDSTNCIIPDVSVITQVGLDHQKWLGNTIEDIAREKAGIIKHGVPVVTFLQDERVMDVLRNCAKDRGSPLEVVEREYEGALSLAGNHQKRNAALALRAVELALAERRTKIDLLQTTVPLFTLDPQKTERAFANTTWPGRFQIIDDRYIIDGAHNRSAVDRLVKTWQEVFPKERPLIIFGACRDKEYLMLLRELQKLSDEFIFVPINSPRSVDPCELIKCIVNSKGIAKATQSVKQALEEAKERNRRTLVTGSLFLVGEVLAILQGKLPSRPMFQ